MKIACFILFFCTKVISANLQEELSDRHNNTLLELHPPEHFTTKCFDGLGCFYNGPPFYDPILFPFTIHPSDYPLEKIKFSLFTKSNENRKLKYDIQLTEKSIRNSKFSPKSKTMIYIHGWQLNLKPSDDMFKIKDALFDYTNDYHNFILVNWTNYSGGSMERAAANGRVIGTATAKLIHLLMNYTTVAAEAFHVVGHSVGAQMTAYVGQQVPGLGRITGLDTGGPQFHHADKEVRLDDSDAMFVDGIHTNGAYSNFEGIGYNDPYANQDFFVNGGHRQPGCRHDNLPSNAYKKHLDDVCNHGRSVEYFLESIINKNCTFKGTQCDSYEDWKAGKCPPSTHPVAIMGLRAKPIPGLPKAKFYLKTRKSKPFCKKKGYIGSKGFS